MILDRSGSRAAGFISRRSLLQAGAAAGGGLLLSLSLVSPKREAEAAADFAPNAFIRIERDGQIVLTMPYVEMGQGTYTSIPMSESVGCGLAASRAEADMT